MTQNTFFNILAVLGILYGILRGIRAVNMAIFLHEKRHLGAYAKPRYYIYSAIGTITFFAGIYKLFVR